MPDDSQRHEGSSRTSHATSVRSGVLDEQRGAGRECGQPPDGDQQRSGFEASGQCAVGEGGCRRSRASRWPSRRAGEDPDLDEALAALPAADREVLYLWSWEHLPPLEIAVMLGINANAANMGLYRATRRLRERLAAIDPCESGTWRRGHYLCRWPRFRSESGRSSTSRTMRPGRPDASPVTPAGTCGIRCRHSPGRRSGRRHPSNH